MSRVGKVPINISDSIKVSLNKDVLEFNSDKENQTYKLSPGVKAEINDNQIKLSAIDKSLPDISMFVGMNRSNIQNIVTGLIDGFKTTLEINGVGYKASVNDNNILTLTLGYSHEIYYAIPEGITAKFEKPNLITITGQNKVLVGQVASEIISFRKTEPYKGKGVKIQGQRILRKEGKKK
ncbi:MAG: 50S ribosomal protein L6 [Rickettsiales bacterium]|nr:50S ribosomal protein L6 [Rickettsiales bacterium]